MQPVRGTHDLLPDEYRRFAHVIDAARDVARLYGYREMATPIFEFTELFARGIGETTDVVSKEMYTFQDRGGESLTLRPEYTAGICRAFVSNGELAQQLPLKLFAAGPMFRYERPQKGRQRQFHQIDLEVLGAPEPGADIEVISVAADILERLGILDRCVLKLNSLGDPESRTVYRKELVGYYSGHAAQAFGGFARPPAAQSPAHPRQQGRGRQGDQRQCALLCRPPEPGQQGLLCGGEGRAFGSRHFVRGRCRLVRGLDYYTHTAFEFVTTHIGAQGTVLGGGRYDGLIAELGGPPTAGIGWAGGIERLMMLCNEPAALPRPVVIAPLGAAAEAKALGIARALRRQGIAVEQDYRGTMKRRLQRANKLNARAVAHHRRRRARQGRRPAQGPRQRRQREVALDALAEALKV